MSNKISNDVLLLVGLMAMFIVTYMLTIKKRLDRIREESSISFKRTQPSKRWRMNSLSLAAAHNAMSFWRAEFGSRDFLSQLRVIPHNTALYGPSTAAEADEGPSPPTSARSKSMSHAVALRELSAMPGCEPDGPAVKQLRARFPEASVSDCVRFLVARKGEVGAATEMMEKANTWRKANLPVPRSVAEPALATGCCFFHGQARDGTPCIYFRGGLYDNTKASFQTFVLVAAQTIDHVMANSKQLSVTVVVHLGTVVGGPNAGADMNFIKYFVQVLSDNYPERLRRLVMYPFPWYGRAIWSCVKVFVDKRSQDKVLLYPCGPKGVPEEVLQFIDAESIPECCEGKNKDPIVDMLTIFPA
jgi:hypothetical protein